MQKQTVLFLCTNNSARSQMAEVLLRHKCGDKFDVFSAGTHPENVDLRAVEALTQFGVDSSNLHAKSIEYFIGESFDYVISLCDKANTECRSYPNAGKQIAWDFTDPNTSTDSRAFSITLNELNTRLSMFLLVEGKCTQKIQQLTTSEQLSTDVTPIDFYKCLTDPIRLKTLMLSSYYGELCVCELMQALEENSQPKVSRNLAVLKKAKVIIDRKHGQWVFYKINPDLALWAKSVITQTTENNVLFISKELQRLKQMKNRPNRTNFCK